MITLTSALENKQAAYVNIQSYLEDYGFTIGGNWEYDHGYFDANLDEAQKIWVRIPFTVIHGTFDGDTKESDAVIRLGKPFALKHLYEEGLDNEARPMVSAALVNQFQDPVDKDAEIEQKWLDEAENLLKRVEQGFPRE
ncbi:YugN family protein [Paenibacillus aurantius]|uniref:YugN family protein n=1 Tax=Paenibacillus aurantius TaxID=2918900 RepID=A0AA96LAS7_9BACL|nr:YugN family protein [Paenibacillus aurantius]WNQ10192.1 YugN family protein [Paenibacillus aurantius]